MVPREFWRKAAAQGMIGFDVPAECGGPGLDDFRFNAVGHNFQLQRDVICAYLCDLATEEQKARWLRFDQRRAEILIQAGQHEQVHVGQHRGDRGVRHEAGEVHPAGEPLRAALQRRAVRPVSGYAPPTGPRPRARPAAMSPPAGSSFRGACRSCRMGGVVLPPDLGA